MTHRTKYSFKSSRVQGFNRTLFGYLILTLELLNPLNLEPTFAQANYYQGKTITFIVGTKAGDVYDLYPRLLAEYMPKYIPGNPNIIIQNVAGRGVADRGEPSVQHRQARRGATRRDLSGALLRSIGETAGSEIRLEQVWLDRQSGGLQPHDVHAQRHTFQDN